MRDTAPGLHPAVGAEPASGCGPVGEALASGPRSTADDRRRVDPLTGLEPFEHLLGVVAGAPVDPPCRLVVVVVEVLGACQRVEHARRLAVAGDMGRSAFGQALAVGSLGARRVGILAPRGPGVLARADVLARMVADVPGRRVRVDPVPDAPAFATWLLHDLAR